MTLNAAFNEELAEVDGTKEFDVTINGAWGENEFSVSGYSITAGSDEAAGHAAAEALYELGYRFWAPEYVTRPASLPGGGVTLSRRERFMPYCTMFYNYGYGGFDDIQSAFERYRILNGCVDSRRPLGHAWGSWFSDDRDWFDDNPTYWSWAGGVPESRPVFDLATPLTAEALAQRAAFYLSTRLNDYNRAAWDPPDGDDLPSEQVWPWAARCAIILRNEYAISDAQLGVYAYGGHRNFQPIIDGGYDLTGVYGQVTLGFNDLGIGYPALVDGWGQVLDEVALRGYGDIAAQSEYLIPFATSSGINFLTEYTAFKASGADGVFMETSGNWLKNLISHYTMVRVWAAGGEAATVFDTALSEAVSDLFEGDSAVGDLYELWAGSDVNSGFLLNDSFEIVNSMQAASWWRERFRQFMDVQVNLFRMPGTPSTGADFTLLEKTMRKAEYLYQLDSSVHGYAIQRQEAGSGNTTSLGRGDLNVDGNPHWRRYPAAPTETQIDASKAYLDRLYGVPSETVAPASLTDWVEVSLPDPVGEADRDVFADAIYTRFQARMIYAGPGSVTVSDNDDSNAETTEYGAGLHEFTVSGEKKTTWSGGTLYPVAYPTLWKDQGGGSWWGFLPQTLKGWHKIYADPRLSVYDEDGRKDVSTRIPPFPVDYQPPQSFVPGTIVIHTQTRGLFSLAGACPTIAPTRDTILMPRALAIREGLL